jgi:hypothetical protein
MGLFTFMWLSAFTIFLYRVACVIDVIMTAERLETSGSVSHWSSFGM